ncbi:MAG: hypothetical protein P4M09_28885 [Devosia sp.]|nr:hypothetical protein [Devosia sp.]
MSLFNLPVRGAMVGLTLAGFAALSACTFTPAFNDTTAVHALMLGFAPANNPLEQIVYQDLGRRFGLSDSPDAPQVSVTVASYSRALAQSTTVDPAKDRLMTATGILRITRGGQPVLTTTRQATATYTADTQVLADKSAETAAQEQAAHALADTLELTILATLAPLTAGR